MNIYYLINKMNQKVDYLMPDEEYNPKQPDWDKVRNYVNVE